MINKNLYLISSKKCFSEVVHANIGALRGGGVKEYVTTQFDLVVVIRH